MARTGSGLLEPTEHASTFACASLALAVSAPTFYCAHAIHAALTVALVVPEVLRWLARGAGDRPARALPSSGEAAG